jgi:hypothetical protein
MRSHDRHARSVVLCLLCCLILFEFLAARAFLYPLHYYNVARCVNFKSKYVSLKKKESYTKPHTKQPSHLLHILNYVLYFSFCEIITYEATLFLGIS